MFWASSRTVIKNSTECSRIFCSVVSPQGSAHNRLSRMRPGAYQMFWASSRTVIKKQHGMLANFLRGSYRTGLSRIFRIDFSPFRKIDTENSKVDESAGLHRLMLSRTLSRSLKIPGQCQCFTAWRLSFSPPASHHGLATHNAVPIKGIGRTSSTNGVANIIAKSEIR